MSAHLITVLTGKRPSAACWTWATALELFRWNRAWNLPNSGLEARASSPVLLLFHFSRKREYGVQVHRYAFPLRQRRLQLRRNHIIFFEPCFRTRSVPCSFDLQQFFGKRFDLRRHLLIIHNVFAR